MSTSNATPASLTECISRAQTAALDVLPRPDLLYLSATGVGLFPEQLADHVKFKLDEIEGVPECWSESVIHGGRLGPLTLWMLDDENFRLKSPASWHGGFTVWLAATCGASCMAHVSAGFSLPGFKSHNSLVVAEDHVRFGDHNPLEGIGPTPFGPLFPDLSFLHDEVLRRCATERANQLGIELKSVLVACTRGPALETPAERSMLAGFGAQVCVQSIASPFLAAGHAGLPLLSIIAVTDSGEQPADMKNQLQSAELLAPQIDDLLVALMPDIESRVAALKSEQTL